MESFDLFHFFVFVMPGFVTVWSFRYFTDSKKNADFEYFALSVVWGFINLLIYELVSKQDQVKSLLQNQYAAAAVLSLSGLIIGWLGGALSRTFWCQKVMTWLKNFNFNIFEFKKMKKSKKNPS